MTLRARLVLIVVAVTGLGLLLAALITSTALRAYLLDRVDGELQDAEPFAAAQLTAASGAELSQDPFFGNLVAARIAADGTVVDSRVHPLASAGGILEALPAHGTTDLASAIDFVAEKAQRRALVFILSDLFDPSPKALQAIARLRRRRCEVAVFHLLDRDEMEFPFEDPTEFLSLEGPDRIEANPRSIREGYLEEFNKFLAETRRGLLDADVERRTPAFYGT